MSKILIKKSTISIIFIGHVDAGKSTISGQMLYKLGMIDERTLAAYKRESEAMNRESWYLSWALDTSPEERAKGKTTEINRIHLILASNTIVLLDAPGHKLYVSDMIIGANQADVAILVVSARVNEFEAGFEKAGQTREHILLAKAAGIEMVCVLVNKMDDKSVRWSQKRFDEIRAKLKPFLSTLFKKSIVFIPISGFEGSNFDAESKTTDWYNGPLFFDYLNEINIQRKRNGALLATILDEFKLIGNSVYSIKVLEGMLKVGDTVLASPSGLNYTINKILDDEFIEINEIQAGDIVRIEFTEDTVQIQSGDIITTQTDSLDINVTSTTEFTCQMKIINTKGLITPGYCFVLHLRTAVREAKFLKLRSVESNKKILFAKQKQNVLARVKVFQPIALINTNKERFAVRRDELTIALGIVRKIF